MPLHSYGVLVGHVLATRREGREDRSPHYQIHVDAGGMSHRIAVNVLSQQAPSELRYLIVDGFVHPVLDAVVPLDAGWTGLSPQPGGACLDYVRGNLFDPGQMRLLPPDLPGSDNDLADLFDHHVERAAQDHDVVLYAFGERWGPEPDADQVFGFRPGNGVHDIHMNQGNSARFRRDDGVWQDGGLLLHHLSTDRWVGVFLAFQSQSWHTDDATGHAIEGGPDPDSAAAVVRVVAALVNPHGPSPEAESVTVLNASPDPVDLTGWALVDQQQHRHVLGTAHLGPGEPLVVPVSPPVQLGNSGGSITLLDGAGLKVHGVSYTRADASRQGWTVVF